MNKKTKLWLGAGVLAVAAYYFWNKKKTSDAAKASFANVSGKVKFGRPANLPSGLNNIGEKLTYGK